mgnify:CR=1 FL=1|tara:strand:+ start:512 stop:886 length:375 start_codon:yes stop_codon:yes gene_type:complete
MSYDINFSKEMLDVETNETEFQNVASLNYTSNMKGFFVDFFENFGGLKSLNGLSGKELINEIDDFNGRIIRYANGRTYNETLEELAEDYNPENGWGSVQDALWLVDDIKEIAIKYPSAVCSVTC